MNFFENELQKIVRLGVPFTDPKYVGGACYGRLDDDLIIKLQFNTSNTYQRYEGIKATVINRNDGPVDSAVFLFADVLGRKRVDNPDLRNEIIPYARTYNGKTEWYAYQPTPQDYKQLCGAVSDYCGVFQAQEMGGQGMRMSQQL